MSGQLKAPRRSREARRLDRDEWRLRQIAFQAAQLKAEAKEKTISVGLKKEELDFYRVYPDKRYVAGYFLEEKTDAMLARGLKYKFRIPEDKEDPEVPLILYQRDLATGEEIPLGEAGDLYHLLLHTPGGISIELDLIVESRTSVESPESWLYYSCYDIGHGEKAYTVPNSAWQNYLTYREDVEGVREELDIRLLFLAVGHRNYIGGCNLDQFKKVTAFQLKRMMGEMLPGFTYVRPTVAEAQLNTLEGDQAELLRMSPVYGRSIKEAAFFDTPYFHLRRRTTPRVFQSCARQPCIDDALMGIDDDDWSTASTTKSTKSSRSSRSSGRRAKTRKEKFEGAAAQNVQVLHPDVQKLILDCFDPQSQENIQSQNLAKKIQKKVLKSPRGKGKIPKSWKHFSEFTTPDPTPEPTTPPGAELTAMEVAIDEIRDQHNHSELEAMGGVQVYVDDLNDAREGTLSASLCNSSLISGLEILKVTLEGELEAGEANGDDKARDELTEEDIDRFADAESKANIDDEGGEVCAQGARALSSTQVIPAGAEDDFGIQVPDLSYLFNDSVELWLAKHPNESDIVTVETDDSALSVNLEVRLTQSESEEIERSFPEGFLDEDLYVVGFNLKKFK